MSIWRLSNTFQDIEDKDPSSFEVFKSISQSSIKWIGVQKLVNLALKQVQSKNSEENELAAQVKWSTQIHDHQLRNCQIIRG